MLLLSSDSLTVDGATVFPDHIDPNQFWYLPAPVDLAKMPDSDEPQFLLIEYAPDLASSGVKGVGFLNVTTCLKISDRTRDKILGEIQSMFPNATNPHIAPVPFDEGTVRVVALDLQGSGGTANTAAPGTFEAVEKISGATSPELFGDNNALFSLTLTEEGASIMKAAFEDGMAPVGVIYDLKFTGVRPALDVKITADLKRVYDSFSVGLTAQAYYVSAGVDATFEKLRQDGAIKIEVVNLTNDQSNADKEQQALALFKDQILSQWFTPSLSPATAAAADANTVPTAPQSSSSSTTTTTTGGSPVRSGGAQPAPGGAHPAPGGAQPAPGGAHPAPGGAQPAPGGAHPAPGGAQPAPGGAHPAPGGVQPAPGGAHPAPSGAQPAPGGAHPAPAGAQPASSGATPSRTGPTPAPVPSPAGANPPAPGGVTPAGAGGPAAPSPAGAPPAGPSTITTTGPSAGAQVADAAKALAGVASAASSAASPFGVSLRLKFVHQDEQKTVTYEYNRMDAVQRTFSPQGYFGLMLDKIDKSKHFLQVDGTDPFFSKFSVAITPPHDFAGIGLQTAHVAIDYGDPNSDDAKHGEFDFTAAQTAPTSWDVFEGEVRATEFTYTADYSFDPQSGWVGAQDRYQLPAVTTENRQVTLDPYALLGFLTVTLSPGKIDANSVDRVEVTLHYAEAGGWQTSANYIVHPGDQPQAWKVRLSDKTQRTYTYTTKCVLKDGTSFTSAPVSSTASAIIVNDAFTGGIDVVVQPAIDAAKTKTALLEVEYQDQDAGYAFQTTLLLPPGKLDMQRLHIPLLNRSKSAFGYRIITVGTNGQQHRGDLVSTQDPVVLVGDMP